MQSLPLHHVLFVYQVSRRLNEVQEAGNISGPVGKDCLGGLLRRKPNDVVRPVDLGVDAAFGHHT